MAIGSSSSESTSHTIFIDTNLNTHLAIIVSDEDTVLNLKQNIISNHVGCFPEIGEITIQSIKVKRKSCFYHLSDSVLVKSAFNGVNRTWFLYIDAASSQVVRAKSLINLEPGSSCPAKILPAIDRPSAETEKENVQLDNLSKDVSTIDGNGGVIVNKETAHDGQFVVQGDKGGEILVGLDAEKKSFSPKQSKPLKSSNKRTVSGKLKKDDLIEENEVPRINSEHENGKSSAEQERAPKKKRRVEKKLQDDISYRVKDTTKIDDSRIPVSSKETSNIHNLFPKNSSGEGLPPPGHVGKEELADVKKIGDSLSDPNEDHMKENYARKSSVNKKSRKKKKSSGIRDEVDSVVPMLVQNILQGSSKETPENNEKQSKLENSHKETSESKGRVNNSVISDMEMNVIPGQEMGDGIIAPNLSVGAPLASANVEVHSHLTVEKSENIVLKKQKKKKSSNVRDEVDSVVPTLVQNILQESSKEARGNNEKQSKLETSHKETSESKDHVNDSVISDMDMNVIPGQEMGDKIIAPSLSVVAPLASVNVEVDSHLTVEKSENIVPKKQKSDIANEVGSDADVLEQGMTSGIRKAKRVKKPKVGSVKGPNKALIEESDNRSRDISPLISEVGACNGDDIVADLIDKIDAKIKAFSSNGDLELTSSSVRIEAEIDFKDKVVKGEESGKPKKRSKKSSKAFDGPHSGHETEKKNDSLFQAEKASLITKDGEHDDDKIDSDSSAKNVKGLSMERNPKICSSKDIESKNMSSDRCEEESSSKARILNKLLDASQDVNSRDHTSERKESKETPILNPTEGVLSSGVENGDNARNVVPVKSKYEAQELTQTASFQETADHSDDKVKQKSVEVTYSTSEDLTSSDNESEKEENVSPQGEEILGKPNLDEVSNSLPKGGKDSKMASSLVKGLLDEEIQIRASDKNLKSDKNTRKENTMGYMPKEQKIRNLSGNQGQKKKHNDTVQGPLSKKEQTEVPPKLKVETFSDKVTRRKTGNGEASPIATPVHAHVRPSPRANSRPTLKENRVARANSSTSSDTSVQRVHKHKRPLDLQSRASRDRVAAKKAKGNQIAENLNSSDPKKSLLATSNTIFDDSSSESSEDEREVNNSEASTRSPSSSSSSEFSQEDDSVDLSSPGTGSYHTKRKDNSGKAASVSMLNKNMSLNALLKSSQSYKKAKLTASQSQQDDIESEPIDFFLD